MEQDVRMDVKYSSLSKFDYTPDVDFCLFKQCVMLAVKKSETLVRANVEKERGKLTQNFVFQP